ncbi:MAG: preprotein translocase subunit SecE [Rhodocyclaceae bacterium]|nr:preprotein translocase subunit SecE [Rhodocyclaceae bacterium]
MADNIKFALAMLFVVAGLVGFYLLADQALIFRVLAVLAGVAAGVALAWNTVPGQRFKEFGGESIKETRKVAWPTRKESLQTTGIVFAFVVVMAIFLYVTDKSLEWVLYDLILGWKKS